MLNCYGIFLSDVNKSLTCPDCKCANNHPLNNTVRVPFHETSIHKSSWITFIAVGYDILDITRGSAANPPFYSGWKSATASSSQAGGNNRFHDFWRSHRSQRFTKGGISTGCDIVIYICRVNLAAVIKNILFLFSVYRKIFFGLCYFLCERIFPQQPIYNIPI